jgi:hypothetical protein
MGRFRTIAWIGALALPALLGRGAANADAAVYYVSNSGSDAQSGLAPETAWRTIASVNGRSFQSGDSVLFRRGDVWRETLYVHSSGTSQAWLTIGAYGTGNRPRILGSERASGWTQVATNVWRSATSLGNPYKGGYSYGEVFFEHPDGTTRWGDQKTYDAAFSLMTKERDWSWNANTLYVYSPSDPASRYAAVEVPQRDNCIGLPEVDGVTVRPQDYVQYLAIDGLELMYAMRQGLYTGYNEIEAHGLRVTNCHIGFIGVRGGSSAWHSDMLIQGNTIHDCGRRGVSLNTYTNYTPGLTVRNVTIDGNHFYNGFHTTGPDISTISGRGHTFTGITISNNLVDDTGRLGEAINEGCYASSCSSNSIYVQSNGNTYTNFSVVRNTVLRSTSRALLLVGIAGARVQHNTIYGSHPGARPYSLIVFNTVSGIDFRNNVVHGTLPYAGGANDARCVQDQGASSFAVRNYNLYHQDDPAQPFTGSEFGVGGWDTFISEWDSWRAASGFEANSPRPQNPQFVNAAAGDLRLGAGSAAIDAGVRITGVNDSFLGSAPDLGALEYQPPPSATLSVGNASIAEGDNGTRFLVITVTLSDPAAQAASADSGARRSAGEAKPAASRAP